MLAPSSRQVSGSLTFDTSLKPVKLVKCIYSGEKGKAKKHRGPGPGAQLPLLTVENVEMETSPDAPLFTFYE